MCVSVTFFLNFLGDHSPPPPFGGKTILAGGKTNMAGGKNILEGGKIILAGGRENHFGR